MRKAYFTRLGEVRRERSDHKDQLKEPLAPAVPAAFAEPEVDPLVRCASSDPPAPPERT